MVVHVFHEVQSLSFDWVAIMLHGSRKLFIHSALAPVA